MAENSPTSANLNRGFNFDKGTTERDGKKPFKSTIVDRGGKFSIQDFSSKVSNKADNICSNLLFTYSGVIFVFLSADCFCAILTPLVTVPVGSTKVFNA